MKYSPYRTLPDGSQELVVNKVQANFDNVLNHIYYITEHMNSQSEPYDGLAGFSQGNY